jgi:hypothetical protein
MIEPAAGHAHVSETKWAVSFGIPIGHKRGARSALHGRSDATVAMG